MRPAAVPSPWPYRVLLTLWAIGSVALALQAHAAWLAAGPHGARGALTALLLTLVTLAQSVGSFFLLGFLAKAIGYLALPTDRATPVDAGSGAAAPPIVVLYLTAGDFDPVAVESLLRLESPGERLFVLHDDGADDTARRRMREAIERHPCRAGWQVEVAHRPERRGGKAGAVNWVLERLDPRWELLLLCDSDSIATGPDALGRALPEFADPGVAVVQFRNAGHADPEDPALQQRLAWAIDVFDAFATPQARWGYLPFFGHNALLRLADVRAMGGLTPGFFSDDLDLSVRLTLAGRRIVYRRDIVFAERHPADWSGFRKRARKWAFGCMQVVRARGRAVLTTRGVPFAHRIGMLEFMGFYPAQALLLVGLVVGQLLLPWLLPAPAATAGFVAAGAVVTLALLAPTLAWAARERRLGEWPAFAWVCALVYGGSMLATARGVFDGLSPRERPWIPTNLAASRPAVPAVAWGECAFGLALFVVPWLRGDAAPWFAATYLFVGIFLFAPLTAARYRERPEPAADPLTTPAAAVARSLAVMLLGIATLGLAGVALAAPAPRVEVSGERLLVDHAPFQVRGIHYSPWGPGAGPGRSPYPSPEVVERDLDAIHALGANTLLVHDAPGWVVRRAWRRGIVTLYAFDIGWNDTTRAAFERRTDSIVAAVDSLRDTPGLLGWVLGNEVPVWVVDSLGAPAVEARLRELAARVRAADPAHPLGHANWPPTRQLDLSFLDLACFNLYPAWPYEVAVRGFGPYLREVLAPLARGKPLIVTEFGINSLEAGETRQATVIADCWREIADSPAVGGVLMEWSDEWWKNYDNPIPGQGYWQRRYDPDDAARHDDDPEEYYGIVHADRSPKPALAAVHRMWTRRFDARALAPWAVLAALALGTIAALRPRRRRDGASGIAARDRAPGMSGAAIALVSALALAPGTARATPMPADTLTGWETNAQFGWYATGGRDLLGDGHGATVVGARFQTTGVDTAAGAVYVYSSALGQGFPPVAQLLGITPHEHFGEWIATGADVDGDGHPDLAVGAPLRSSDALSANGGVDVFRGGALGAGPLVTLAGEASNDWFGQSVALGDVDGDGYADVIVGAPYNDRGGSAAGAVFIFRGGAAPGVAPWKVLVGEASNDQFGWSVAYLGDFDGDGYGDVAVGARLHTTLAKSSAGRVYLFRGGPAMDSLADGHWDGEARDDWFGNSVAGPGDVDGGGRADLLVGAPYNDRSGSAAGAAYLFRGEDAPGSAPVRIYTGEIANAQFGWAVAGAGDVDGDGHPDVVGGARMQPVGANAAAGRVYVYGGGAMPATPIVTLDGEAANDWFGNSVAAGVGAFQPGAGGTVTGAPYHDDGATLDVGRVVVAGTTAVAAVTPRPASARATVVPNPVRAGARLSARAAWTPDATFELLDVLGRAVRRLPAMDAGDGRLEATWDGRDASGHPVPAGVYLVRHRGAGDAAMVADGSLVVLR